MYYLLVSLFIIIQSLIAEQIEWPMNYSLVLKVSFNNETKCAIIPTSVLTESVLYIADFHCLGTAEDWLRVNNYMQTKSVFKTKENDVQQTSTGQIVHVCCVSILHGTCSHQTPINLETPLEYQESIIIPEEILEQLQLEPLDAEELIDYQNQKELGHLTRYDSVPEELISIEPPSKFMVLVRKVGISALLGGLKIQSYIAHYWQNLKELMGY